MGEVYRARDTRLGRDVAVKVLPEGLALDAARLERFAREARAVSALNHPNILTLHDVGDLDGVPYLVSELLEGSTLRAKMGPALAPARAIEYAIQIARALGEAHDKGIIHRDLKPENVFVTRDGRTKVLDFGLAKLLDVVPAGLDDDRATSTKVTTPGAVMGTPSYMSPEQAQGHATDHRTDLFALGVILYEMLSGQRPFRGASTIETLNAILNEEAQDLSQTRPGVAPALAPIVARCLAKSPSDRYQSARDLAFQLEALTDVRPGRAPRASRWPWLLGVAAALVLGVVAGGAFRAGPREAVPVFKRLTYRRGTVGEARFAADGQTVVYGAAWQGGPQAVYTMRVESLDAQDLDLPQSRLLSVSDAGEIAVRLPKGTLARAPIVGGAAREVADDVVWADWGPKASLALVRRTEGHVRVEYPVGRVLYETLLGVSLIRVSPQGDRVALVETTLGYGGTNAVVVVGSGDPRRVLTDGWRSIDGLAWSHNGREIWFSGAGARPAGLYAVTLDGATRPLLSAPGGLRLLDVFRDGRALLVRLDERTEIRGRPPGEARERDLSWLAVGGISDLSADGRTLVLTDDAVGGGVAIYSRRTDGSPAVRLGDGGGYALSPDDRTIISRLREPNRIELMPTGAGEAAAIAMQGIEDYLWATWFPDGKRILVAATELGHGVRLYIKDLASGAPPLPLGPEGLSINQGSDAISPDGKVVAALASGRVVLMPVGGGEPQPVPGVESGEVPSAWSADGRSLYVYRRGVVVPCPVTRVELDTGRRQRMLELMPADPAGVRGIAHVQLAQDLNAYVYNYGRVISDLYLVEGIH